MVVQHETNIGRLPLAAQQTRSIDPMMVQVASNKPALTQNWVMVSCFQPRTSRNQCHNQPTRSSNRGTMLYQRRRGWPSKNPPFELSFRDCSAILNWCQELDMIQLAITKPSRLCNSKTTVIIFPKYSRPDVFSYKLR